MTHLSIVIVAQCLLFSNILGTAYAQGKPTKQQIEALKARLPKDRKPSSIAPAAVIPGKPGGPSAKDAQINSMLNQVQGMQGLPKLKDLGSIDRR
jgi:hypothetical protein